MSQLVGIPDDVDRFGDVGLDLERVGLNQPTRPARNQSGQPVDDLEAYGHNARRIGHAGAIGVVPPQTLVVRCGFCGRDNGAAAPDAGVTFH